VVACAVACQQLTGDFSDVIAIEYTGPASPRLEEGDTVTLTARAIDIRGKTLPEVQLTWVVLELDTVPVGISLDSLTGHVVARTPGGPWRVQGRAEGIFIDPPIQVFVTGAPDSIAAVSDIRLEVDTAAEFSPSLVVMVYDLTSKPGEAQAAGAKPVIFDLVDPAAANGVALESAADTVDDPLHVELRTASDGRVSLTVRRVGPTQPDSIVVEAVSTTALGDVVAGSPVRFTVIFLKN